MARGREMNSSISEYNKVTEMLLSDNKNYEDIILSGLISSITNQMESKGLNDEQEDLFLKNHFVFQVSFICLKVFYNCRLIACGNISNETEIKEDISRITEILRDNIYGDDEELTILSFDILCLVCHKYANLLMYFFPEKAALYEKRGEVSSVLFYLAQNMAECYKKHGYEDVYNEVWKRLCCLIRKRNTSAERESLLLNVLRNIIDDDPHVAYSICCDNEDIFVNETSISAGDFYWFFSNSSYAMGILEPAKLYLEKCIDLRNCLLGKDNWYTVTAECELIFRGMSYSDDSLNREYIMGVIEGIEKRIYSDLDMDYAVVMEGRCVYHLLHNDPDMDSVEQYLYYVDLFEKLCNQTTVCSLPFLSPRMGKNIRGTVCLRTGDYIGAEKNFVEALSISSETDPSGTILSDAQLKSNLLMAYFNQNDIENVLILLDELLVIIENENNDSLSETDIYRIYSILVSVYSYIELDGEAIENLLNLVEEECESIMSENDKLSESNKEQATFICSAISILLPKQVLCKSDCWKYYKTLNKIKQFSNNMHLEKRRVVVLNYILALLAYNLDLPTTGYYMRESLIDIYHNGVSVGIRAAVLSLVAVYYARDNKFVQTRKYLDLSCIELEKEWKQSIRYLNDTRLMNVLAIAQLQYHAIYATQRQICDIESSYNSIIRFKALASLAGKERNRAINSGMVDSELMERIRRQQNIVAQLEADPINHIDENALDAAYDEMRTLETEFSERFPDFNEFKEISLERIMESMPDNSVVVEYFDTIPEYGLRVFDTIESREEQCIDIFILRKINGICTLYKHVVDKGETVLNKAEGFANIYKAISDESVTAEQLNEQESIRHLLYVELIAPIKKYINGVDTVYIAPSSELINLPFGLLKEEGGEQLFQEEYCINMIECARDFLFATSGSCLSEKALVIGDPEYEVKGKVIEKFPERYDESRGLNLTEFIIKPLPFSGIEALRISNHISTDCCIGTNARKNTVLSATNYKNIHLATHGLVDYEASADTLYSTCLLFAGAQNWLTNGKMAQGFENGIVTADEISRLNWKNVELVVLSTCMSGMNDYTINKGFNGMVSALSAAGVKYVICSLWNQSDFGTAVMMEEFYRLYKNEGMRPVEALRGAQKYLKNVTIRELRERGWLNITDIRVKDVIDQYRKMNDRRRPFRNEVYWGGFECFRCN